MGLMARPSRSREVFLMKRVAVFALTAGSVTLGLVVPAGADPKGHQIVLDCGSDGTATVNVFSNGRWSPGLDADGTAVFIPTAFGELSGTFTPADGTDPIDFSDPPAIKSSPMNKAPELSCTFTDSFTDVYGTGVVHGSVIGFKTPAHG
jgi:hypothetical protein